MGEINFKLDDSDGKIKWEERLEISFLLFRTIENEGCADKSLPLLFLRQFLRGRNQGSDGKIRREEEGALKCPRND